MFVRFNFEITSFKKLHFFSVESTSVTLRLGNIIFKTKPGKPAPVPISHSDWSFNYIILLIVSES